jgi:hypothetical protein
LLGPHGKHRLPLLWMHVSSCVVWQQTSYISVRLLGADRIENIVSLLLLLVFVFTELLPGNALIRSVTILKCLYRHTTASDYCVIKRLRPSETNKSISLFYQSHYTFRSLLTIIRCIWIETTNIQCSCWKRSISQRNKFDVVYMWGVEYKKISLQRYRIIKIYKTYILWRIDASYTTVFLMNVHS